jgi:two-component system response regulator FixJ
VSPPRTPTAGPPAANPLETVCIVDDDEAILDSLSLLLQGAGYDTATYGTAGALLAATPLPVRSCGLIDVRLPDMTGLELLDHLRGAGMALPVVIMTAYADVPLAVQAMKAGAIDFIEKPYACEVVLQSVGQALQQADQLADAAHSAAAVMSRFELLTPRERDVMALLVSGLQNKQIAHRLAISPRTVEIHRSRVMEKMAAASLSHLVRMTLSSRLPLDPPVPGT